MRLLEKCRGKSTWVQDFFLKGSNPKCINHKRKIDKERFNKINTFPFWKTLFKNRKSRKIQGENTDNPYVWRTGSFQLLRRQITRIIKKRNGKSLCSNTFPKNTEMINKYIKKSQIFKTSMGFKLHVKWASPVHPRVESKSENITPDVGKVTEHLSYYIELVEKENGTIIL